jgi:hypothetical protein
MTGSRALWEQALTLMPLLGQRQTPALLAALDATGMSGRPLGMLLHAWDVAPRALTPALLAECTPYYTGEVFEARMIDLTEHGFLAQVADHAYELTDKGRAAAAVINRAGFESLAAVDLLPAEALARLVGYFERLVSAALRNPLTPDCPCLADQHKPDRPHEASYLGWLTQYLGDLYRYKCDCHTTAFRPRGVSGFAMEPYTHIWREGVATLDALVARTAQERMGRGHSRDDYDRFVDELAWRGWVSRDGEAFALTDAGRIERDAIEAETDAAFFGVWDILTAQELDDMAALVVRLKTTLETA